MSALTVATVLSGLSLVLLAVLAVVWVRVYRDVGTPLVLGLVAFIGLLLVENLVAVSFYLGTMETLYADSPAVTQFILLMRGLQLLAVTVFTYISLRSVTEA